LPARVRDIRLSLIVSVVLVALLSWRLLALIFNRIRVVAGERGRAGTQSLMRLSERLTKVLVILIALFVLLRLLGVDMKTALTGVGIGGVALALGAQKSVENLLGAVSLLTDKAIAIGDLCAIGDRLGRIEDITLRSVRLRTLEQTVVSIPASALSQASIENFTTRQKILVQTILRLRYGTTVVQLHAIIDQIHDLIVRQPDLDAGSARVRLVNFGPQAIEIELFTYVKTADVGHFMAVRENLLLAAAAVIESAGSAFAGGPVQQGTPARP
jgi:MscS family membrane protein